MLIAMILVVIVVSVAMLFAILSSFIPFSNAYGNIVQYSSAYYAAMSAIERGSLAVRKSGPGFDGESGWKFSRVLSAGHYDTGSLSDAWIKDFVSYGNAGETTLYWNVKSKTNSIPREGEGNVDPAFIDRNINIRSFNYNALNYNSTVLIPLGRVGVINPTQYYIDYGNYGVDPSFAGIRGHFRINPYLFTKIRSTCKTANKDLCASLCTTSCPGSTDYTMDKWTPIVDWVIKGIYPDGNVEVSILPSEAVDVGSSYYVHVNKDSLIRKSNIWQQRSDTVNSNKDVLFAKNKHPLKPSGSIGDLNILSRKSDVLKTLGTTANKGNFIDVISNLNEPLLSLELINFLWSAGSGASSRSHHLYPFLEYKFTSEGGDFSDIYYTIRGEGKVGKYDVRMQVKKPTLKDSSLGNFTIIF